MLKFKTYRATLVAVLLMSQALVAHDWGGPRGHGSRVMIGAGVLVGATSPIQPRMLGRTAPIRSRRTSTC